MREWVELFGPLIAIGVVCVGAAVGGGVAFQRCQDKRLGAERAKAARVKKLELDHAVLKERLRRCKPMEGKP